MREWKNSPGHAAWIVEFVVILSSCATTAEYGTFLRGHESAQYAIAADAAGKLAAEYTPDGRAIRLERQPDDLFGARFATELRKKGYSLQDGEAVATGPALHLRYVLDAIKGTDLFRLSIFLPRRRLSRAYAERSAQVFPSGPWCVEVQND